MAAAAEGEVPWKYADCSGAQVLRALTGVQVEVLGGDGETGAAIEGVIVVVTDALGRRPGVVEYQHHEGHPARRGRWGSRSSR